MRGNALKCVHTHRLANSRIFIDQMPRLCLTVRGYTIYIVWRYVITH